MPNIKVKSIKHNKASNMTPHKPKAAKTLMRHIVKKPAPSFKRQIHAYASANVVTTPNIIESPLDRWPTINKTLNTPKHLSKSPLISHFSKITSDKQIFDSKINNHQESKVETNLTVNNGGTIHKEEIVPDIEKALKQAINSATSHLEPPKKLPKSKMRKLASKWTVGASVVLFLVIGLSQNYTSIRVQFASAKAGLHATLPKDLPAGFSLAKLTYDSGLVNARFNAIYDDRSYSIVQKSSNWGTDELKNNFLAKLNTNYYSDLIKGITVYIYGDHNAAWVKSGVWYNIQSNGTLSNHELIQMASST